MKAVMKKYLKWLVMLAAAVVFLMPKLSYSADRITFTADDQYKYVKFGNYAENSSTPYKDEMKWIILDPEHTNADTEGALLLLQDYGGLRPANCDFGLYNTWEGSEAQKFWAGVYSGTQSGYENAFKDWERDMILGVKTNEESAPYMDTVTGYYTNSNYNVFNIYYPLFACDIDGTRTGDNAALDKIFYLSAKEYFTYSKLGTPMHYETEDYLFKPKFTFYLRTPMVSIGGNILAVVPGEEEGNACGFIYQYPIADTYHDTMYHEFDAAPALNLDLDKVSIIGGDGTWDDPYILDAVIEKTDQDPPEPDSVKASHKDTADGVITNVDDTMEYCTTDPDDPEAGTPEWIPVPEGSEFIPNMLPGDYYVRYRETKEKNPSPAAKVTVGYMKDQDPPGLEPAKASGRNESDGKVKNVDDPVRNPMEYSTDRQNWTAVPEGAGEITGLKPGNYYVRYKGDDEYNPSEPALATVGYRKEQDPPNPDTENASSKDASDGLVTGVDGTMEYSADGRTWKPVPAGAMEISGLAPGDYYVRYPGNEDYNPSEPAKVTVGHKKEQDPPAPGTQKASSKDAADGSLTNVDGSMEYSNDDGRTWKPVSGNAVNGLKPGEYSVRYRGNKDHSPSEPVKVKVGYIDDQAPPEIGTKKASSKQAKDGVITGVDDTMEYSTDGKTWESVPEGAKEITGLACGSYYVRYKADKDKNPGEPAVAAVAYMKSQDKPKVDSENASTKKSGDGSITLVNDKMEYSADGKKWKSVPKGAKEITGLKAGTYYVRFRGDDEYNPGESAKVKVGVKPAPEKKQKEVKPEGILLAQVVSSGSTSLKISWTKMSNVDGYDLFMAKCNHENVKNRPAKVKTIKGSKTFKWTKKGLKKNTAYKFCVRAFVIKNKQKVYVAKSPEAHAFAGGWYDGFTNAKSVTANAKKVALKVGKTFVLKGKIRLLKKNKKLINETHAMPLRYYTDNKKVASVDQDGVIKAKKKGTCKVYMLTPNGVRAEVKVTVK